MDPEKRAALGAEYVRRRAAGLHVKGDTFRIRSTLKSLGGLWDVVAKCWLMPDEAAKKAGMEALASAPPSAPNPSVHGKKKAWRVSSATTPPPAKFKDGPIGPVTLPPLPKVKSESEQKSKERLVLERLVEHQPAATLKPKCGVCNNEGPSTPGEHCWSCMTVRPYPDESKPGSEKLFRTGTCTRCKKYRWVTKTSGQCRACAAAPGGEFASF